MKEFYSKPGYDELKARMLEEIAGRDVDGKEAGL
jgi:hypothetical protein